MKTLKVILASAALTISMSTTALAGTWQSDSIGWQYQNDDGSYPVNTWQWIDGNGDGISESYYFDSNGYCLENTTTPDGYTVNQNGAWIVDGVIQTQTVSISNTQETSTESAETPVSATVWLSRTGTKYHSNPSCSNMKNPIEATEDEAIAAGRTACSKCY